MTGDGNRHCPFLNRDDPRCAAHLGVNRLQQAFAHCAGDYGRCPTYGVLLDERHRLRGEAEPPVMSGGLRYNGRVVVHVPPITPLTLRGRYVVRRHRTIASSSAVAGAARPDGPPTLGAA